MEKKYEKDPNDIGAFWKYTSKKGLKYYSGKIMLGGIEHKIVLFKNKGYEEEGKKPYFKALLSKEYNDDNKKPTAIEEDTATQDIEEIPF
jgi:hypothetical protein